MWPSFGCRITASGQERALGDILSHGVELMKLQLIYSRIQFHRFAADCKMAGDYETGCAFDICYSDGV